MQTGELSEEDRRRYIQLRDEFRTMRVYVESQVAVLEGQIREQMGFLATARESKSIHGAVRVCEDCGIPSMTYSGAFPGTFQPDFEEEHTEPCLRERYKCLICGRQDEELVLS